mmetsp:Transcript_110465/g.345362  ORF Transcript_110465/g.345362 Transcript_110465/m.345362 type:complete len:338 (+) Transcript_110465:110-1123(+)
MASSSTRRGSPKSPPPQRCFSLPVLASPKRPAKQSDAFGNGGTRDGRWMLHQHRERHWLRGKAKHGYLDFSDREKIELRRYFDALTERNDRSSLQLLENMLISLGLAETREEVASAIARVSSTPGELDFADYLDIVRSQTDPHIVRVFKAMMEGKLGDRNLNFQTVLSNCRRKLMLDATGARSATGEQQELGSKILENFATLQRSRHAEAMELAENGHLDLNSSALRAMALPFECKPAESAVGPLEMLWRSVCREQGLYSSRPASAESRHRRTVEKPQSPEAIIQGIIKVPYRRRSHMRPNQTIVIQAPALEEGGPGGHQSSRGTLSERSPPGRRPR